MTAPTNRRPRVAWWRRPWVIPLGLGTVAFLAFSLPPYLSYDPAQTRVPAPPGFPEYYWILHTHIMFGTIALVTCCLQVWPWLRQRHPKIHRTSGRLYVLAGVLPSGLLALPVAIFSLSGPSAQTSSVLQALLWLGATIAGFRAARARRFREHRRWMVRSFALTTSIVVSRIWLVAVDAALKPTLETGFDGNELFFDQTVGGIAAWLSWVVNLLLAEWWLSRKPKRGGGRRPAPRTEGIGGAGSGGGEPKSAEVSLAAKVD
ncbi:DUF2306 domain-containing protein [Stackebrandtia nassauensis]|uniref:DUF2306 domain-containing protein n=1 Tax=Stackebrandtia nassauensis (strain DSM 44728 / CIP 108903 / NRRL B-16338 / NBRC 102104 / LLR-40K-21) TaxID=446470 RepID=D3Q858_STANL|nr:DUF2306 domain-containing protein [Stackebrandtia nassauensis]ADD40563.1 hypothetical protein Snas_0852 [Stackebrandtia nassauensis DSM 44728]